MIPVFLGTVCVLALKVLCPQKPLSLRHTGMVGVSGGVAHGGEAAHWPCPHPSCTDEETDLRGRVTYPEQGSRI